MDNEKTIEVLNSLVVINKDRIEGYEKASENTKDTELKTMFSKFEQTSHKCRDELIAEIENLGGKAEDGTKASGKFFRTWMDIKSALAGSDRKAVLSSCEEGEKRAVATYKDVLDDKSKHLNGKQQSLIETQYALIEADRSKIRTMQNALVAAS